MNVKVLLSSALIAASLTGAGQSKNVTYAITGDGSKDFLWMNIRQVDLSTGQITKTIFQRSQSPYKIMDVTQGKPNVIAENESINIGAREYPTATLVASAAYDKKNNKLFFTPMRMAELRWLDLNADEAQPKFYTITPENMQLGDPFNESNHITRMVIGADGNGYALTNDAKHLFRFTTGKHVEVTDLGNVVDAETNTSVSIQSRCTSWGGDMVADAYGKLYVITAGHHIFSIDPSTRIATHMGMISGLPAGFTTNAAAVNDDGDLVVASANMFEGYYVVNMKGFAAVKMEGSDTKYNASDLANGNLLFQKEADAASSFVINNQNLPSVPVAGTAKIFPNPVTNGTFNVIFNNKLSGKYQVVVSDLTGRVMQTNTLNLARGVQNASVRLNARLFKGMMMVQVLDEKKESVITEKIMVQ